ncbi:hypothetical protein ACFVT5_19270 [Streptomyces sp. NPDC058001]|uniref:hypothetical protein n=1 Tax=Streptomyces sp. NPDC058001 TaxID=3346300 RepID=UPI0036E08CDC
MEASHAARIKLGEMLEDLRKRAEASGNASFSACAEKAGVSREAIKLWCSGKTAPLGENTDDVERLVVHLRQEVGEAAGFDDEWRQALEAAQWESEDHRGSQEGRGKWRQSMVRYGAERFAGKPLHGRRDELKVMRDFVHASDDNAPSYLWWQGPRWAGKSALLGRFLWLQPKGVDVVGYFVSEAKGWNRSDHFVGEMVRQLTALLGRKTPAVPENVPPAKLHALFRDAAVRSARNGRRLLVVVDGLDEDAALRGRAPEADRPGNSIASLLPYEPVRTPKRATKHGARRAIHVIVSSRPTTEPPADVQADHHPLRRRATVRALRPSAHARDIDTDRAAREELAGLGASEVGRILVGLLAFAGAGLRAGDLAELASVDRAEVDRLLAGARGHCLVPDGAEGHVFGDDELLHAAQEQSGRDGRALCTGLLDTWADSWQARGWPASTPPYLLSHYPRLLCEPRRLERYVLDPRRQLRLAADGRLDEALAQLDLVPADEGGDLGVVARVAVSRALLSRRARLVPRDFPEMFALAGDLPRARELALSAPDDAAKAVRLADVAVVLTQEESPEAAETALAAAEWAVRAMAATPLLTEQDQKWEELAEAVAALYNCGQHEAARTVLRTVLSCEAMSWASRIRAAKLLDTETTDWLLGVAEHAEALIEGDAWERAEALEIWGELIRERVLARSDTRFQDLVKDARPEPLPASKSNKKCPTGPAAIRERIEIFCAELNPASDLTHIDLLALGASALKSDRPDKARTLAQLARKALLAALTAPEALAPANRAHLELELSTTLARVVRALLDVDHEDAAKHLLDAVPNELHRDVLGDDVRYQARAVLDQAVGAPGTTGQAESEKNSELADIKAKLTTYPAHGQQLLSAAFARWEGHASAGGPDGWALPLAGALAATGHAEEAVRLARRSPEPAERAGALATVSMGCALANGYGAEAGRCAWEAAELVTELPDPAVRGLVAQAFAHAGESGPAETWASWDRPKGKVRDQIERARTAVAVGLAAHDPETAARIVEERLTESHRVARSPRQRARSLPRVAELLLVLPDPRHPGPAMRAALADLCARTGENIQSWNPHAVLLNGLLAASGRFPEVPSLGDQLSGWERYMAMTPLPGGVLPVAEWAILRAFRGDVRAARDTAGLAGTPGERAAALAAVAAYLAGVPTVAPAADGWAPQATPVLRFLALADALGTDSSRDEEQARHLVREVLAGEHWRYALPLLPRLAPRSVPQLAEVTFAHTCPRPN